MIHQYISSPDIANVLIGFNLMVHASPEECWDELLKAVVICSREGNHLQQYTRIHQL